MPAISCWFYVGSQQSSHDISILTLFSLVKLLSFPVVLWPPSASPFLYPRPLYGEASNHSSVALENPDLSVHPRAKWSMEYSQKVILHAGDALFIPEGWEIFLRDTKP
ncbi:hypothetical protein U1Q18_020242 [Sarracenia purpurea var. burkii]